MNRIITSAILALTFVTAAIAAPVTVAFDTTYASHFIDKGTVASNGILFDTLDLGYQSFGLTAKTYAPTELTSGSHTSIAVNRIDTTASYSFTSTLADLTLADTLKHYKTPGKTGQGDHNQSSLKVSAKGVPVTLIVRYDIATRNLNTEANAKLFTVPFAGFNVAPSVYAGVSDVADQFPHSLKQVSRSERYYGGGLGLSRKVLGGALAVGGYINQLDHGTARNRTLFWTAGYSIKR